VISQDEGACRVESVSDDSCTLVGDVPVTGDRRLNDILEVPDISKGSEFVGHVAAERFWLNDQLVVERYTIRPAPVPALPRYPRISMG
jgi:hypothetical protein